jgi:hypothetical protein
MAVETVVAYDAHERLSVRHMMKRNGPHVSVCGESLQPWGHYRYLDGLETSLDSPEADCRPCLFKRAVKLVFDLSGKGVIPGTTAAGVNAADNADDKIVLLLAYILNNTAWQPSALIREHFPRALVERAAA